LSGVETEAPLTPDFPQRATWIPSPTLALFSIAIFVGSGLVFLIEPMVGKMLLPLFGGTPAVWAVTLVFFQAFLLAGYAYAHVSIRLLGIRRQALVQLGLLVVPLALLPIAVPRGLHPSTEHPAIWLLGVLFLTAALPFFVVSSASPVLQRWFSASGDAASRDPYFLYAASNAGSLLGLLAYPMLLEPRLTLAQQSRVWTVVYVVFAVLTALCVLRLLATSGGPLVAAPRVRVGSLTWRRRLRWIGMAALPSSLMLGTTSYITTDIGSFPLLWVLPLAAYLISFILAFARRQLLSLTVVSRAIAVTATLVAASLLHLAVLPIWALVGVHTLNLFFVALLVHRLLAIERPPTEHLTEYYLLLSVGGVCGGIFNALVAPVVFSTILEYPIVIVVALALRPGPRGPRADARFFKKTTDLVLPLAIAGGVIVALIALNVAGWLTALTYAATLAVALMAVVLLVRRPVRFAAGIAALVLIPVLLGSKALHAERTFFGVLKVESGDRTHRFVHGTTLHGVESFAPGWRDEPLSYYSRQGPIGQVFQQLGDRIHSVGAIGLGAGTIAAYGKPGDRFTFYEIDAAVARIASNPRYFTFLRDSKAAIGVVIGDGRVRIAEAPRRAYDLVVLDAFSSDAVPVHLLTREAVELYLSKLRPGGLLAFHISSNYLDLKPVIAGIAQTLDCTALTQEHRPLARQERMGADRSIWVVVAPEARSLAKLRSDRRWKPLDESADTTVWTDQFSNILSVVKWLD
jgi:hypothetical protein